MQIQNTKISWSGLLHTMAEGCDHRILRTLENHPEAVLWKIETELCGHGLASVIPYSTGLITRCYNFIILGFMWAFLQNYVILNQGLWEFGVSWSPGLSQSGRPWNLIHCMPRRIPCTVVIYSNFIGPLGPQVLVGSEVGEFWHVLPMRDFRFQWSWAIQANCANLTLSKFNSFFNCTFKLVGCLYVFWLQSTQSRILISSLP